MIDRIKILIKRLKTFEYSPRYSRIAGDLESYEAHLQRRLENFDSDKKQWAQLAMNLVNQSRKYMNAFKIDEAWKLLHTAKRMEVHCMSDLERSGTAKSLLEEIAKTNEWRRKAIISILGKEIDKTPPDPESLVQALELKDDYYNNQYYKNKLTRNLFSLLFFILSVVIIGISLFFIISTHNYGTDFASKLTPAGYITGVLLFGFLGATTSAILFTRTMSNYSRISEIGSSQVITLSKIFVGVAFSLFIYLLLRSSIAGSINLFSFSIQTPLDYFSIAFVSGFTERLAQKAILLVVGKEEEDKEKKSSKSD